MRAGLARVLGQPPQKQIVICGYSRGGTSLLYNMVSATLRGFRLDQNEVSALESIRRMENHASKEPVDVFVIPDLVRRNILGKELHVVVCIRDLRDIITSKHPNIPDRYAINYADRWSPRGAYPNYTAVKVPLGIRAVHAAIESLKTLAGVRLNFVYYEELVENPDAVQARLAEALGVTFAGRFSEFHEHPEKHAYRYADRIKALDPSLARENSSVDRSRHGKWRRPEHARRIYDEFSQHPQLFDVLRQYGYESNDAWFAPYRAQFESTVASATS